MQNPMSIPWLLNDGDREPVTNRYLQRNQYGTMVVDREGVQRTQRELTAPRTTHIHPSSFQGSQNLNRHSTNAWARSSRTQESRPSRPKYTQEEGHFIWYQRIDLGKDWKEVSHAFNDHFPAHPRDGESGLQCRFYRILECEGIPNIRSLGSGDDNQRLLQYGLVRYTRYRYSWMLPEHQDQWNPVSAIL